MSQEPPPRPDADTGRPIPPPGKAFYGKERRTKGFGWAKPDPPVGAGPTLHWWRPQLKDKITTFIVAFMIISIGTTIIWGVQSSNPVLWIRSWQMWLIVLVPTWLIAAPLDYETQSVGADWFQWKLRRRWYHFRRPPRAHVLYPYELVSITTKSYATGPYLRLEDARGNVVDRPRSEFQGSRDIWDYLYNGIVNSVHNGARVDSIAAKMLQLGTHRKGNDAEESQDSREQ